MSITQPDSAIITATDINRAVMTYTGSKDFIRMMLPVTVINILHNRTNIASENFRPVTIDKFNYVSFKPKSQHKIIREYHTWMKGAIDAIDKTYLKEMILILSDENDQREHYKFQFKYLLQEISDPYLASKRTGAELTKGLSELMEQIKTLQKYKKLTGMISARVQFNYVEAITPIDYMPPYFHDVKESVLTHFYDGKPAPDVGRIILGFVNTGHHSVKCTAYGTLLTNKSLEARSIAETPQSPSVSLSNDSNENPELTPTMTLNEAVHDSSKLPDTNDKFLDTEEDQCNDRVLTDIDLNRDGTKSSPVICLLSEDDFGTQCICNISISDPNLKQAMCQNCTNQFHIACHGYLHEDKLPKIFICNNCIETGDFEKIDTMYLQFEQQKRKLLSIMRLIISYCIHARKAPHTILNSLQSNERDLFISQLISLQILDKNELKYISENDIQKNVDFMSQLFIKTSDKDGDDGTELPNTIPAPRKKKTGKKRKYSC